MSHAALLFGPPLLAFLVAYWVNGTTLVTSLYPNFYFLLKRCPSFLNYKLLYGCLGLISQLSLHYLLDENAVAFKGIAANVWFQAALAGIFARGIFKVQLLTTKEGVPIGSETLLYLFEPGILRTLVLEFHNSLKNYLKPFAEAHPELESVKAKLVEDIPNSWTYEEKSSLQDDFEKTQSVMAAMELCIRKLGQQTLERLFPIASGPTSLPSRRRKN